MNNTIYIEDGKQVYPCRCGEIHDGLYAAETYNHHNCLHDTELLLYRGLDNLQAICALCGKTWMVEH